MKQRLSVLAAVFALGICKTLHAASQEAPDWVNKAAGQPASFPYGKAPAAILLDEEFIDVLRDGTFSYRTRGVVRILTADGRSEAKAMLGFNTEASRVRSFHAWLIRRKGPVLVFGKDKIVETAAFGTSLELYSASRIQRINATEDAEEGSIFAWEIVEEQKSIVSQTAWSFASRFPVECSRLTVRVPEGWQVEPHFFNQLPVPAVNSGDTFTWELLQIPPIRREPMAPDPAATQPYLGLDIKPPISAKDICRRPLFSWPAISAYFSPFYDKAATPTSEMKATADELVTRATTLVTRISQLCQFAQKTNYISILLNAAEGGGMIPQPAEKVFRCNYGDCKDKATFLRAMLRTQGIDSIPLLVHSGAPQHIHPEWASPGQFNHCILAVKVDASISGPSLLIHPKLGRLIVFDPTNPYLPFGTLSRADSGGYGLLLAGDEGELIQLPAIQPSTSQRTIAYQLQADGSLVGTIERHITGSASEQIRAEFRNYSPTDFHKSQLKLLKQFLPVVDIDQLEPDDAFNAGVFTLKMNFTAKNHGKAMRDTLLVFKPAILPVAGSLPLSRIKRTQPIRINSVELSETSQITLPGNFSIDEMPPDSNIRSPFGSYTAVLKKMPDDKLSLTRSLSLKEITASAEQYAEIVRFAEKIQEAEQSPVVLKRL